MAFIRMNTRQHNQGSILEDFIFSYLKNKKFLVYRQDNSFSMPKEIEKYLDKDIILLMKEYPFDFFLVEDEKLNIIEVKSKVVKFTKDDRKFDISQSQFAIFNTLSQKGINIKLLFIWVHSNTFFYHFHNFNDLSIIGKAKLKFKLPKEYLYSPKHIKYEELPFNFD